MKKVQLWLGFTLRFVLPGFGMFLPLVILAQEVAQPERYEVEIKAFDRPYDIVNGRQDGILLLRQTEKRNKQGDPSFEVIYLDSALNERWTKNYYIDRFFEYRGYDYFDGAFYLLFKYLKGGSRDLKIIEFELEEGDTTHYTIGNPVPIKLTEFEMTYGAAIIGGYYNYNPVVIHYSLRDKKMKVLPGIYENRTEIIQVKVNDESGTFAVVTSERMPDKRNSLSVKTYDFTGDIMGNTLLNPDADKGLIHGRAADFDLDINLMCGTYSSKRSTYSRGIFLASIDQRGEQEINYYNYADLENFFNYMKAGRRNRVSNRIERKRINGKKIKFNYRLLVHEVLEENDQFIMVGEAFYPKYSNTGVYSTMSMNNYGSRSDLNTYFAGYRYTHAVVIGFDKKGKVLWDNSFEIQDVISFTLDQFVHATKVGNETVLLYLYENEIRSKIIRANEVIEGKSFDEIQLSFEDDVLRDSGSEIEGLESWYADTFFAYGTQNIKNLRDSNVKMNRRVFYVNKVVYR